jgi:glycosyltransferase involved in cell wall biosynthesis
MGVPGRYGGFETLAEQLARNIDPMSARLVFYCQRSAYPELRGLSNTDFEGHRRVFIPLRANGAASLLHDALAMLHAVLIARVDVMLVLGYSGAWIFRLIRMLRPSLRILTNIDGMEWRRDKFNTRTKKLLMWLEGLAVQYSSDVIADNAALVPLAQSIHPGLEPLFIAYGGDHTLVEPAKIPNRSAPYYLSIARIEPENNCEMLLKAFGALSTNRLVFVGNWNANSYARRLKVEYGGLASVELLDPIYDLSVLAALRMGACGYVHGHSVGGTNPSLVEALFHTTRILAFDCVFNRSTLDGYGTYFADALRLRELLDQGTGLDMLPQVVQSLRDRYRWTKIAANYLLACSGQDRT